MNNGLHKKLEHFLPVLGLVIFILIALSVLDAFFFVPLNSQLTLAQQTIHFQEFWFFALAIISAISATYFFIVKDISETIALFWTGIVWVGAGLEDTLFYAFRNIPIDSQLAWLNSPHPIGIISNLLGFEIVTDVSLLITNAIGVIILVKGKHL